MPTDYNLTLNYSNGAELVKDVSSNMPEFMPLILAFIFFFIVVGGAMSSKKNQNTINIFMWMTIGGMITSVISFFFYLVDNLINLEVLIITMSLTFIFALIYFIATPNEF